MLIALIYFWFLIISLLMQLLGGDLGSILDIFYYYY